MSIEEELRRRILILDGAMGTKIQSLGLSADYYHCGRFVDWPISLSGNNDVLSLTAPDVIAAIHRKYIAAGADIICTNTFSANRISQHEYGCEEVCREMAFEGARIARRVADEYSDSFSSSLTSRKVWVAGSMGPTSKSLTLPSDMADPTLRATEFDAMAAAYREQAEALLDGGADMLLVETCFDALNAKAALYAIGKINEERGMAILFISHDLSLVRQLCHRVIVMQRGHIVETGDTEEVFLHPREAYTKALIDAIPKVDLSEFAGTSDAEASHVR